jgi:signal transduction histidine kinase/ActR/RegA family two-component response regulator
MKRSGMAAGISSCLEKGRSFVREFTVKGRKGDQVNLRLHAAPIRGEYGAIQGANLVFEETSQEKKSEAILIKSERYKAVAKMVEGLTNVFQESIHSMTFLSNQALDKLRNSEAETALQLMKRVNRFGNQSTQALRQLQLFTRPRSDIETTLLNVMDLSDIVREAVERLGIQLKAKRGANPNKPVVDLNLEPGCYVESIHDEILEVLINFLNNAKEACAQGGTIVVETQIQGDSVIMRVQDNGEGFEQENIERMIEPFWTTKEGHSGLGLAVNFAIVKRHGGKMGVKRLKPRGASFSAKFPLAKKLPTEKPAAETSELAGKLRLLLIDDDQPIVETLEKGLSKLGNTVYIAYSGKQGLDLFEQHKVDAIVCDLAMEGMNGWEVSKAVFASCLERNIPKPPFIMLTGWGGQLAREERVYHPDVDKILEKPITILKLLEVVDELTAKSDNHGK